MNCTNEEGPIALYTVFNMHCDEQVLLRMSIVWQPVSTSSRGHHQGTVQEPECIQKLSTMQ